MSTAINPFGFGQVLTSYRVSYRQRVAGALVRARTREDKKITQPQFAKKLGDALGKTISPTQLSEWENGHVEPAASILVAAAAVAGVTVDLLLAEADPSAAVEVAQQLAIRVNRLEQIVRAAGLDPASPDMN